MVQQESKAEISNLNVAQATAIMALTPTEKTVYGLVLQGLKNRDIAGQLQVVEKTVKFHITAIMKKMGVKSRAQLIAQSISSQLFEQERESLKQMQAIMNQIDFLKTESERYTTTLIGNERQLRACLRGKDEIVLALNKVFNVYKISIDSPTAEGIRTTLMKELGL